MHVHIDWQYAEPGEKPFGYTRVLYAYLHPASAEILYLGKADYCTVYERILGRHKEAVFDRIAVEHGINVLHPIVGVLSLESGCRFSSELLSDVESLLIFELQPLHNKQARKSRISRPGLHISCFGDWPGGRGSFIDS